LTDDLVVVTTMAAEAIAFAAADGRELWRYRSEIRSATSPILVDGRVVLATAGIVVALDASGAVLWRISVGDATTEPCAGAGLIVVGTAEGDIVAVGPRD
jgi:outer membrane protein assembly factor BamB